MSSHNPNPKQQHKDEKGETTSTPFLSIAELILPWLTPHELASLSSTCSTLNRLSQSIYTVRSSDASRSFEPLPIPFINTVDSIPYTFFLYTPTHLITPPNLTRQLWGNPNPNPNRNDRFCWDPNLLVSDSCGCDCVGKCGDRVGSGCPCTALRLGEVVTECGPSCGCGSGCGNRASQKGIMVKLKIMKDVNKGWGLFADQFIPSGKFVCEYAGELLTTKEARRRQQGYDEATRGGRFSSALLVVKEHLPSRKACFRINIDATRIGNVGRFINHSCDGGNLLTKLIRSSGTLVPRVCFFASKDIQAGEELSFSYGDVRLRPDGLRCFCGSSKCYGILPAENT